MRVRSVNVPFHIIEDDDNNNYDKLLIIIHFAETNYFFFVFFSFYARPPIEQILFSCVAQLPLPSLRSFSASLRCFAR